MINKTTFTHDAAAVVFKDDADGITVDEDGDVEFDWDEVERVRVDDVPWADAFETTEFYKLPATVAKPIPQQYQFGEDKLTLKKPRQELKNAAWSLHNAPWTLGHPGTGMVKDVGDVHGFWRDPRYIDSIDNLDADLYLPVGDTEGREYVEEHGDVSVGFYNKTVAVDAYDGVVGGSDADAESIDGYQTNMLFDHVASVPTGRCSGEAGCGIQDAPDIGHIVDDDSDYEEEEEPDDDEPEEEEEDLVEPDNPRFEQGDTVRVDHPATEGIDIAEVVSRQEGVAVYELTFDGESTERWWADFELDPTGEEPEEEEPEVGETEVSSDRMSPSDSEEAEETEPEEAENTEDGFEYDHNPFTKSITTDSGTVMYKDKSGDFISGTHITHDYRDEDGNYFAVAPEENADGVPKYPIDSCAGDDSVENAWKLRNHGDITIGVDTLEERIKSRASALDCDATPWENGEENDSTIDMTEETQDCGGLGLTDLSVDAVAAKHDGVQEAIDAKDAKIAELDEKLSEAEDAEERIEELEEKVDEYEAEEKAELVDKILARTDAMGDEETLMEKDVDDLKEDLELVKSLSADDVVANGDGGETQTITGPKRKTPWD